MHNDHPELLKDQYWDELPKNLPDHAKLEVLKKEETQLPEAKDVFDVPEKTSSRAVAALVADVEAVATSRLTCTSSIVKSEEKFVEVESSSSGGSGSKFSLPRRQTVSNLTTITEDEELKVTLPPVSLTQRVSMVPRASIIDVMYRKRPDIVAKQSFIERKMEIKKAASVAFPPRQRESFSDDESEESRIVQKSFISAD